MSRRKSKTIIEATIQSAIKGNVVTEGPVDFAKSVAGGVKGAFQGVGGNYRANRAKTYMDTFAKKTQKNVEKYSKKAEKMAQKMQQSRNDAVQATGDRISQEIDDTKQRVQDLAADINYSFPASISPSKQTRYGQKAPRSGGKGEVGAFRDWFNQNYDVPWDSIGKTAQNQIIDQYIKAQGKGEQAQKVDDELEAALVGKKMQADPADKIDISPEDQAAIQKRGPESIISRGMGTPTAQKQSQVQPSPPGAQSPVQTPPGVVQTPQQRQSQPSGRVAQIPPPPPAGTQQIAKGPDAGQQSTGTQATMGGRKPMLPMNPDMGFAKTMMGQDPEKTERDVFSKPQLTLKDVGVNPKDFEMLDVAARQKNTDVLAMMNAMRFGNKEEAQKHLDSFMKSLQAKTVTPKDTEVDVKKTASGKTKGTAVGKKKLQKGTVAGKKKKKQTNIEMPPEKSTSSLKKIVDKSLGSAAKKYKIPSPNDLKSKGEREFEDAPTGEIEAQPLPLTKRREPTAPIPLSKKKKKKTEPYEVTQDRPKKVKPGKESVGVEEGPIMSMADFMARSADDPEQARKAKEKIDQERELQKPHSRKNKKGKVVIMDKDMGARKEDNFVSKKRR